MAGPLTGVRILAVEQYGAGPYGTQLLAEMGAEVIKIESPSMGGDVSRSVGPFKLGEGDSEFFQTFSRGKKSITLEIKTPEGRAQFERLVATADAVVNNLRGDQPAKLRITQADLAPIKSSIVCGHLSAYGRHNRRDGWPGYDYLMQAEAGLMSLSGEPDGPPTRLGVSIIDFMTGTMFALGVVSGIVGARASGKGCDVDVSLFDVALHQTSYPATWMMNEGHDVGRLPRGAHPSIAPSQMVRTKDGWAMLLCQTQKFWEILCQRAGHPELIADPRFKDIPTRHANLAALSDALDAMFGERTTAEWVEILAGHAPFAPVESLKDALANPFVFETGMRQVVDHPAKPNGLHMLASPIMIDGQRSPGRRAPFMGEHDAELLGSRKDAAA